MGQSSSVQGPALCLESPWLCVPVDGTIHDGTGYGMLPTFADDPSPGADGVWLGDMSSARFCYANHNPFANDQDHDWLDDDCEFRLASAFAPVLVTNPVDSCPGGEPYWAAKYFPQSEYGWGEFVRIAYMPAYYKDCGEGVLGIGGGHLGDSEFIMISVQYNTSTQHWEVRDGYLSAHSGTMGDHAEWPDRDDLDYYPRRRYAYPQVWIAPYKHANYSSQSACNGWDSCYGNVAVGRMRVYPGRNVGSRFVDWFPNGVMSENALYQNDSVEYFYTPRKFRGWQISDDGVTPYASFLLSGMFECFLYTAGNCYWGPGPNPPSSTSMTGVIHGPTQVIQGENGNWTSFVTGGQLPYSAQWWRQYASEPAPTLVGTSNNGSSPFTAGSWTFTPNRCENFTLKMKITSGDSQQYWTWTHAVEVACSQPPQSLTNSIVQSGYYFTANPAGGQQPYTYLWEWCGIGCDGGGGELAPPARPGVRPNVISQGWQVLSTERTVYWRESQRWLRSTVTDSQNQQAVATYWVP